VVYSSSYGISEGESIMVKYVKSQKTGEWLPIGPEDMDYTRYGKTLEELIVERDAINKIVYGTQRYKS